MNQTTADTNLLLRSWLWANSLTRDIFSSPTGSDGSYERPALKDNKESSIPGLYVIGDLAGAPVIKLAMTDGYNVIETINREPGTKLGRESENIYDVIIVGAGAAGLNAALAAQERGFSYLILEKGKLANTIENFPEGKWIYAEPDDTPPKGKLWLDGATKEDLVERWHAIVKDNQLEIRTEEELTEITKDSAGLFEITTSKGKYTAGRIVLATGQRGNPRQLNVPGEDQEPVYHRLYSPTKYKDENIIVVGGGNSAVEAALTLSEKNNVVLSYRGSEFGRVFKDNLSQISAAEQAGKVRVVLNSQIEEFGDGTAKLNIKNEAGYSTEELPFHHAFVLIGAELPVRFLNKLGVRLENEWRGSLLSALGLTAAIFIGLWLFAGMLNGAKHLGGLALALAATAGLVISGSKGNRYAWLGLSFFAWYTIYGAKVGKGQEFWPYAGWGYELLSLGGRPWAFWYTVIYTALMIIFGVKALKRWGIEKRDRFQIWRYISLISFQVVFFFLVPEFLFQYAVKYQWVGESLAQNPQFADQAWRSYGIVYAWPLFFYTFFYDPHQIWVVWGVLLTFLVIPIFVLFNGKRYCSWICGCGGLAETFGDRWRHLAPKGKTAIKWEKMGSAVLILAVLVTLGILLKDIVGFIRSPAERGMWFYRIIIDVWLVGILPVTLYPFMGGKVWCRYWCPLAKLMQFQSAFFAKLGISRFKIEANDKCIGCQQCSRYCQVGINVMDYALKQKTLDNETSSCIGCGICVTVCPMDTLKFGEQAEMNSLPAQKQLPEAAG